MITFRTPAAILPTVVAATLFAAPQGDGSIVGGRADGDGIVVGGKSSPPQPDAPTGAGPIVTYQRIAWSRCGGAGLQQWCVDDEIGNQICADGTAAQLPLFARETDRTGAVTRDWFLVDPGGCPEDGAVPVLSAEEFARLPLAPSSVNLQPRDGRALVHYGVIATTDAAPQTLTTTVLGVPVTVTATPTAWTWDYGDGTPPRTTTDPGRPYPDTSGAHAYGTPGTYRLTVTTTWTGTYQLNGAGPQRPVAGTATTTSAPITVTVETASPHLVAGP